MQYYPPINTITSKEELFTIIESVREYRLNIMITTGQLVCEMYRGQGRNEWKLLPNIVRNLDNFKQAQELEKQIVLEFNAELTNNGFSKSLQQSFLYPRYHTEWLLLQQSQHYRIPTRFMDWTINWEVALFFAVANQNDDDSDGQFWIYIIPPGKLTIDESNSQYLNFDPFTFEPTLFLNSSSFLGTDYLDKIAERRKLRQSGRFCIQSYEKCFIPLEEQAEHITNLTKIIIPKEIKKKIREELLELNYTEDSLYIKEDDNINAIVQALRYKYSM